MTTTCTKIKRCLVPITSTLTVGVVSYISWVYLCIYCPFLDPDDGLVLGIVFVFFPTLIFITLFRIICGDPGHVTKEL